MLERIKHNQNDNVRATYKELQWTQIFYYKVVNMCVK